MELNTTHTRRDLLELARRLGYDWVDKAIANSEAAGSMDSYPLKAKIHKALSGGFVWFDTPQGIKYWKDITDELESKNI